MIRSAVVMIGVLKKALGIFADALFPPRCPLCDTFVPVRDRPCGECEAATHILEGDAHLPYLPKIWFLKCRSRFAYEGKLKDALHSYKYGERLDLVRFLSDELAQEAGVLEGFDIIVPVPLHPKRLRARGFNQSALLARRLGRILRMPVDLDSLARVRDVKPQVGLERGERIENVKGAFEVDARRCGRIADKSILLVDDVLTTGATVNECARTLSKAGAASVTVLTVARTL